MNTAFLDAMNLAWKIHHVEAGFATRAILSSYETERKLIAENLLDFDSKYAALFSARKPSVNELQASTQDASHEASSLEESEFIKVFKSGCEFTSGYGVAYNPNIFNWSPQHQAQSPLFHPKGTKLRTGRVMPPAMVTRVVDANIVPLESEIPVNGSFRIFIFAGQPSLTRRAVGDFAANMQRKTSFFSVFQRDDIGNVDYHERHNPHSKFFTFATTFAAPRTQIEVTETLPKVLARYRDHVYADDLWDRRVSHAKAAAHAKMGLDEDKGGVVVVRPDGYVGCVVKLVEGSGTVDALDGYFAAFSSREVGRGEGVGARL